MALQSTGVYWIPLYDILEERGFEVYLVNARHTKNLPGRKSDVQESQWLLKLHTYGLLNNSFQPPSKIRVLRTYWRQRARTRAWSGDLHSTDAESTDADERTISECDQRSERSDRTADRAGHRRRRARIRGSWRNSVIHGFRPATEEIAKSLEGNWRQELLFVLQQEVEMYDTYQRRIAECDQQLQKHLTAFADTVPPPAKEERPRKRRENKTRILRISISPMNSSASREWI